jgi:hopene-associated glycosyltransferase HpnB
VLWTTIALASAVLWLVLLLGRGGFWRAAEHDSARRPARDATALPPVTAIIPARDEAETIAATLGSLIAQRYPGELHVIVVNDRSDDETAAIARKTAEGSTGRHRVTVVEGEPLPRGWAGKLWAMQQGVEHARVAERTPQFLFFTDADIVHAEDTLAVLVERSIAGKYVLTSLMAKLRCISPAERLLVPAFIFFFQMLYPFRWVQRRNRATAAAAGGCMLVRHDALEAAGGLQALRSALIDDCALARELKRVGPIWLGLTERVRSLRTYRTLADIRRMVARSAYAQLRFSPTLLAFTIFAMLLMYAAPPVIVMLVAGPAKLPALAAWILMSALMQPTLRFYGVSPFYGAALPVIGMLYLLFTISSAYEHLRGRGAAWKGRTYNAAGSWSKDCQP